VRRDRSEDFALVAEREPYDPERNLRLVAVRKHFERWNKIRVRDQVRTQLPTIVGFRPAILRFAIHRQHQDRMVRSKIRGGVVAAIAVCAYRHHHVRFRIQQTPQFIEGDATNPRGHRKIRVAGSREADLGKTKQVLVGDELPCPHLKVSRSLPIVRWHGKQGAGGKESDEDWFHWHILTSDIDYEHMSAEKRLLELGIVLPQPPAPGGNYQSAKAVGNLLYLAGAISTDGGAVITGTAGADRSVAEGYAAARACALTQLSVLKHALGSLDKVEQVVSVNGYVNAVAGFPDSPAVINGASDLLLEVFGEPGRHVRAAVGVSALPRNALVELQMTVAI
jgi:enamine deaminase RidA (YjgF/YER057c/UK114 family)